MALPPDDNVLLNLMPIKIDFRASMLGIEKQKTSLKVYTKTVEGSKAFCAELCHADMHTESCIAVCRKRAHASEIFKTLSSCSHPNIAQPIGLWENRKTRMAYIIFQKFDGVLSTVSKEVIFEAESLPGQTPAVYGFTEAGFNIMSDTVAAVKYINDHYQQETTQGGNCIPLRSLRIEKDTVFYQQKAEGEYQVLLTDFDVDIVRDSKQSMVSSGSGHEKSGSSGQEDIHRIRSRNWNNLGKFIGRLYEGWSAKSEVTHLVDLLQQKTVEYENLIWEAGLWDLSTKMHFIREIFWSYDKNKARVKDLKYRQALGLQKCIDMLEVNKHRSPNQKIVDTNLFTSIFFLRVFILAHQDETWEGYSGPKVDVMDKKAVERFVLRQKDDYMVRLIMQIRKLGWISTSPYLRCKSDYMRAHYQKEK